MGSAQKQRSLWGECRTIFAGSLGPKADFFRKAGCHGAILFGFRRRRENMYRQAHFASRDGEVSPRDRQAV